MKRLKTMFFKNTVVCLTMMKLLIFSTTATADAAGQWRDGAHVYAKVCAYCHDTGIGTDLRGRSLPPEYVSLIVRKGFQAMPAFRAAEIDDDVLLKLANYVNSLPAQSQQEK